MAKTAATVTVEAWTGLAVAVLRLLGVLSRLLVPVFGPQRVMNAGVWAARRLTFYRIEGDRWRRLDG